MKIGKFIKTAIKLAPIVYPIIKKMLNNKSTNAHSTATTRRK